MGVEAKFKSRRQAEGISISIGMRSGNDSYKSLEFINWITLGLFPFDVYL